MGNFFGAEEHFALVRMKLEVIMVIIIIVFVDMILISVMLAVRRKI